MGTRSGPLDPVPSLCLRARCARSQSEIGNESSILANRPEHADLQKDMDRRLGMELKRIKDDFRPGDEHLREWGYRVKNGTSIPYSPEAVPQSPKRQN